MVNAEAYTSLSTLAAGLIAEISMLISPSLKDRVLNVTKWFSGVKPVAEYDAMTDAVKVSLSPREQTPDAQTLSEVLESINTLAAKRNIRIGIVIDEFQVINELGGLSAERTLRAVVQTHWHLSYIFAGSHTRMMLAMISEHKRPFYRLGDSQFLGPIPRGEFEAYVQKIFARRNQTLQKDALTALFDSAEDVPYNVQRLAAEVWTATNDEALVEIEAKAIQVALNVLVHRSHASYLALYLTRTPTQRRVLTGLAQVGMLSRTTSAAARQIGVAASTFRTARTACLDADFLHERFDHRGETRQYKFVDPFFAVWLRGFVRG